MPDYLPKFKPGQAVTFQASAPVTGGQLVVVTGNRLVAPSGGSSPAVVGVAGTDAAVGDHVVVFCRPNGIHPLTAAGPITAGARVISAANGRVQDGTGAPNQIGMTLQAAAGAGSVVDVMFLGGLA